MAGVTDRPTDRPGSSNEHKLTTVINRIILLREFLAIAVLHYIMIVLTLSHRYNAVRGHRTGSNNSGAEDYLRRITNKTENNTQ